MCVYLPAYGRKESVQVQGKWQEIITEWSQRWGNSISAWWVDGGVFKEPATYANYTRAFTSGNGQTIIDNQPVLGCTGGALWSDPLRPGPTYLQGNHSDIDYRNIVLRPVVK